MIYYSKLKQKLIWIAVLIVLSVFLVGLTTQVFGATGNPLTTYENFSYNDERLFTLNFTAKTDFKVEWQEVNGFCTLKATAEGQHYKFYVGALDFFGSWRSGYFVNKDNLGIFHLSGSCDIVEYYTAGENYTAYLVDPNNLFTPADSVETIKQNSLRNKDIETEIDEDSIFQLAEAYNGDQFSTYHKLNFIPEMDITYPVDNSKMISNFEMGIDYSLSTGYDRIMVVFEDWNASSTCPGETDFSYWVERNAYYNHQSLPYFSDRIATSTGTTTIDVYGLEIGKYNCNKCFFVNDDTGAISENLCRGYEIEVLKFLPPPETPETYLSFLSWPEYYAENSEKFDIPTPLYDNLASSFEPLINKIGNVVIFFNSFFDKQTASEKGTEFGNIIPIFRGYLDQFNVFFGGLPVSEFLLFYLITALVVIIYRLVKGLLTIIIP